MIFKMITADKDGRIYIDGKKSNFLVQEFVNPVAWRKWGIHAIRYVRPELIRVVQRIREIADESTTINNWHQDGGYDESGLRDFTTSTGASWSAHKFGAGADLKIGHLSSFLMAEIVKDNWEELYKLGLRRIENPEATKGKYRSWLHIDTLETFVEELVVVNP